MYHLGELSFYMDEETTSFASRSMAEGNKPQMPSCMPYHRSISHSWLNSISARLFGLNGEISYRLPSAILGALTAPLIFVLARPYVGSSAAFLAALLLALSEWHIIHSRQARMYAPFLFFYIACAFSILQWAQKDELKYLVTSIILFVLTVSFHSLGVFAAFIPLTALLIKGYTKTPHYKLIIFAIIGGVSAYLYGGIYVGNPYREWTEAHSIATSDTASGSFLLQHVHLHGLLLVQGTLGLLLGLWLGRKSKFPDIENGWKFRIFSRYLLAILSASLATTGQIHGAFLSFILLMLLYPDSLLAYLKQAHKPIISISCVALIVSLATIKELGIVPGIKSLLAFPYPNWIILGQISPGITILFISAMIYLAIAKKNTSNYGVMVLLICGLFPIILVGIFKKWAPARYLLEAYPFILISSAYVLHIFADRFLKHFTTWNQSAVTAILYLIGISGILGGHGFALAYKSGTLKHGGSLNEAAFVFPVYPDHKLPGEFVAKHREAGDIVIAEDALMQRWYAGNIDYWLRNYNSHKRFLYIAEDQQLHDIYVNSVAATPDILNYLSTTRNKRIWIITTSEITQSKDHYLTKEQLRWLNNIEENHKPLVIGKDNMSKVYCLNCERSDPKPSNQGMPD